MTQPARVMRSFPCAVLLRPAALGTVSAPRACAHSCQWAERSTQADRGEEGEGRRAEGGDSCAVNMSSFLM